MSRRVVVTGIGLVTALGSSREETWSRMIAGECGIRPVTVFDTTGYRSRVAAEVDIRTVDGQLGPLRLRRHSRSDRIGLAAAAEAVADSGVMDGAIDPRRVGIFFGAGTGDLLRNEDFYRTWLASGIHRSRPSDVWNHFLSTPVDVVATRFGFEGPRGCIVAACSSSTIAIGRGEQAIRSGRADVVLAGGTDALARLTFTGFNLLRLMDPEPCRPFDHSRAGMNIGEGAGVLVLEALDHARRRGARVHAELAGHAAACEAYHPTAPDPEGRAIARVISAALEAAGINAAEVDHVNAHGTGTQQNDTAEARGLKRAFGDRLTRLPVTSVKSMVGHCLGASGAVEAAVLALTVARGVIPPTIHHDRTDAECPINIVSKEARETRVRCGVSTSLGFGGNDSAIVVRSFDG
jgi:3-oxoacyl-[acyl-carrier-protein] synthase II